MTTTRVQTINLGIEMGTRGLVALSIVCYCLAAHAAAQPPVTQPPATQPPAAAPAAASAEEAKEEPPKPPEPERVTLDTKDGWKIHAIYYAPMEKIRKAKETVPIILLHGWEGQGAEFSYLATGLQSYGHAVLVPDLRGHGRSTTRRMRDGSLDEVKVDDLKSLDMEAMYRDVEACKKFLRDKNNEGLLNIDMLTVIGAEEGSIIAVNWAAMDWSWPATPVLKQGQDVKALILLSPMQTFKRMNCSKALQTPAISKYLSILFAVGEQDSGAASDAKRIYSRLERMRPPLPSDLSPQERMAKKDLVYIRAPTTLQGTKLTAREFNRTVNGAIIFFINVRILDHRDEFPWKLRGGATGS